MESINEVKEIIKVDETIDMVDLMNEMLTCSTVERAQYCLDHGCDINMVDQLGRNVLNRSFSEAEIDLLKFYISKGVSLKNQSIFGLSIMNCMISMKVVDVMFSVCSDSDRKYLMNDIKTLRYLVSHIELRKSDSDVKFDLIKSRTESEKNMIDIFIKHGFDVNHIFVDGGKRTTLLKELIRNNKLVLARYVLSETDIVCDYDYVNCFCLIVSARFNDQDVEFITDQNIDMTYVVDALKSDDDNVEERMLYKYILQLILFRGLENISSEKSAAKLLM